MLVRELYTMDYFKTGRYAPEFDAVAIEAFANMSPVVEAQQYIPVGQPVGAGKLGGVFEVIKDDGGLFPRREHYSDIKENVVASEPVMVFMGINSEKVIVDKGLLSIHGDREKTEQLNLALQRLHRTFVFKLFNADKNDIDATDLINNPNSTKKYDFDGWVGYFRNNPEQTEFTPFVLGDVINNVNMKLEAQQYLLEVASRVNVAGMGHEMIYTTRKGKIMLKALQSYAVNYVGPYQFSRTVETYEGIPIIEIDDSVVPYEWKQKGEFVLFVNQNEQLGARIMVPDNGGLIKTYADADTGYQLIIRMDMVFAPVLVHPKCGALCFLKEKEEYQDSPTSD